MNFVYIDNNELIGATFVQLASHHASIRCVSLSNGKKAIIALMELSESPYAIIINCALADVSCKTLILYIRKQDKFLHTKIVVVGDHFTDKEKRAYAALGTERCVSKWPGVDNVNSFINDILCTQ